MKCSMKDSIELHQVSVVELPSGLEGVERCMTRCRIEYEELEKWEMDEGCNI